MLVAYIPSIVLPIILLGLLSLGISTNTVESRARDANMLIVAQLRRYLDTIVDDIDSTSLLVIANRKLGELKSASAQEKFEKNLGERDLNEFISLLRTSKPYVYAIHFEFLSGKTILSSRATQTSQQEFFNLAEEEKSNYFALQGSGTWSLIRSSPQGPYFLRYSRLVKEIADQVTPLGFLSIFLDCSYLSMVLRESSLLTGSVLDLVDDNGSTILASSHETRIGGVLSSWVPYPASGGAAKRKSPNLNSSQLLRPVNWEVVSEIPMAIILRDNARIIYATVLAALFGFGIGLLITTILSKRIVRPLESLRSHMNQFSTGGEEKLFEVEGNDEIALLGRTFNELSLRLKELTRRVYLVQIEKRDAELAALTAQINPHFLFNTLDTIYWTAKMEKAEEASNLIKALSSLFRLSLSSDDGLWLISEELDHIRSYIMIQQKRYKEKITFAIEYDEGLIGYRVVKLILQPLVENAIVHGFESADLTGNIRVKILRANNCIEFIVSDDGLGADDARIMEMIASGTGKSGFALRNVDRRVKLLCGDGFGLVFQSCAGKGTEVTVTHPVL
jgi:two-component system, sensor histidine kinase YesM